MNLIASATLDWGIGFENELLFRVSKDMVQFRKKTTGNVVVMGRNTFLSMPNQKPLPNRVNIVLSSDESFSPEGVRMAHSLDELFAMLGEYDSERVFVIGGAAESRPAQNVRTAFAVLRQGVYHTLPCLQNGRPFFAGFGQGPGVAFGQAQYHLCAGQLNLYI